MEKILPYELYHKNELMWKQHIKDRAPSAAWVHLVHTLLCGKDVTKGFPPLSSKRKIDLWAAQGKDVYHSLNNAAETLKGRLKSLQRERIKDLETPCSLKHFIWVPTGDTSKYGFAEIKKETICGFDLTDEAIIQLQERLDEVGKITGRKYNSKG